MQFAGDLLHLWGAAAGPWAVLRAGAANVTAVLRLSCLCHLGQAVTVCRRGVSLVRHSDPFMILHQDFVCL